jgi:cell division transport system ATP-binding protein
MIDFNNVSKIYYPDITAVKDVNIHIDPGEMVFMVGQSGSGKTTLVKLLTAEIRPTKGRISLGGWDITEIRTGEVSNLRRQIGVVFQDFKLLPKKTVYENVAFALEVCGEAGKKISTVVPQVLKIVGLEEKRNRYPRQLSGGEQQRVAIARALVHRPKLLIADEPTGDLDSITAKSIVDLLLKINEIGTTMLFVTHNRDIVNMLHKRVITIENGQVVSDHQHGKYVL